MPPEAVYLAIGRIVGVHGVRGDLKMEIHTQHPERIPDLRRIYLNDDPTPVRLRGARLHAGQALLSLESITDRDAAEALRGSVVRISGSQARPLEEGEFYHYQLIGLQAVTEEGIALGELQEIIEAGEVDVYVVRDAAGKEHLFPALRDVVLEIDPAAKRLVVRPQQWED
jgi:16S rRNA processing protein RimM